MRRGWPSRSLLGGDLPRPSVRHQVFQATVNDNNSSNSSSSSCLFDRPSAQLSVATRFLNNPQFKNIQRSFGSDSNCSTMPSPLLDELARHNPNLRVKRPGQVEKLLEGLVAGGRDRLQVIADFDHTLSRAHKDGKPVDCSWGVIDNSPLLPKDYTARCQAIKAKYIAYEKDPDLTVEEKTPYMVEWYTLANQLLQECGVNASMFPKMVQASDVEFRDHTDKMLDVLNREGVPVLILSAGLGDLLVEIMKHFSVYHDNTKVVSNFLAFDDDGKVSGVAGDMIHVFNKNESAIHGSPYFKTLEKRKNIILMGDSLGDLNMASGFKDPENLLKIGFLNDTSEQKIKTYMDLYDIVLVDDQSMDVPNKILGKIFNLEVWSRRRRRRLHHRRKS